MMDKFREYGVPFKNRKDIKEQLFVVFFGKPTAYIYNAGAKVFKQEFPNIYNLIGHIKKKAYNRLSILLQSIESYTILERVCPNIAKQMPELPILTKHDSILPFNIVVFGNNVQKAKEIMVNTVEEVTGLTPQGRMKRYLP
jgi:hypothetical protein